jgi:hypothetical protein
VVGLAPGDDIGINLFHQCFNNDDDKSTEKVSQLAFIPQVNFDDFLDLAP